MRRHDHNDGQAGRDDHRLADVEQAEQCLAAHGGALVAFQRLIVATGFVGLVGEIFHRLVIDQAVDRARVGLAVAFVHAAVDVQPPIADLDRIDDDNDADGRRSVASA